MMNYFSLDFLLCDFEHGLCQSDASEIGSELIEHSVDLISGFGRHVVRFNVVFLCKLLMDILFNSLHVIQVDLVAD